MMKSNLYKKCLTSLLLITIAAGAWGQPSEGLYFIANYNNNGYNAGTPANNFYLVPAANPQQSHGVDAYYADDFGNEDGDPNQPFLATKKTNKDVNSVWRVDNVPGEAGFYYIIHQQTGRYVIYEPVFTDGDSRRKSMHLKETNTPSDEAKFEIITSKTGYAIRPKLVASGNCYFNVASANTNDYYSTGPTSGTATYFNGLVGLYSDKGDKNGVWCFEKATIDSPTITNNETVTNTFTITAETGATIYYTTDGSTPTTSDYTGTGTTSVTFDQTASMTIIKAIAMATSDYFPTVVTTYNLPVCERPAINVIGGTVTITCATAGAAIYYTTNGDPATTSSTPYTEPFAKGSTNEIRAIATKAGYVKSSEATILPPTEVSSSDEMTDMSGNYILASDFSSNASIGTSENPFSGTIDGNLVTLSGLNHPLVAYANGATIKNVMLKNVQISGSGNVGAIAGEASGYTRIYNCGILPSDNKYENESSYVSSSDGYCGGLVGWLKDDSRVINCFSYANITGGTTVAGIVGYNDFASTTEVSDGKYTKLKTAVVNCMFYGNITGGSTRYPVYGGEKILNNTATGINNYDFYRAEANLGLADNSHYNCSWPAQEEYLTKYEYYRYLLNSNRELCGWWVGAPSAPSGMLIADVQAVEKDASLMAKWVLDPSIAPYPILKAPGKYFSAINQDPDNRINPVSKTWESRPTSENTITTKAAPDTEGQKLGSITVNINKGGGLSGSDSKNIPITAMDIANNDFCYGKIQLPYYNSIFGDPNSSDWATRYGGNYGDKVVVGWEITDVTGGTPGTLEENWETGYNFADRDCTNKDKERVFAQGGYYYVPNGVTEITITAKWADATYLDNNDNYYDRISVSSVSGSTASSTFSPFEPAGKRSATLGNEKTVKTGAILNNLQTGSVYEKAIVLVGNNQNFTGHNDYGKKNNGFTVMSADFDLDDEPDYSLIWQLGNQTSRYSICPIRFDFLPVIEMGMAMKEDGSTQYYSLGCYRPLGHFEVTETSLIHFGQFEFGNSSRTTEAPLILNGGIYDQYTKGTMGHNTADDKINYIIIGGNVRIPSFTPGAHPSDRESAVKATRHCALNVMGGNIDYLYLTGNYNENITPNQDNPHCYIDGGNIKQVAAAGKEGINGDVFFKINHSVIEEFYGGSTMDQSTGVNFKTVKGNINVTVDNSKITKYCGGPKFGNMNLDAVTPANNKTVTTNATGTTFGVYYGGGNGGTSYVQYASRDNTVNDATATYNWNATGTGGGGLNGYTPNTYRDGDGNHNYMADYEMEIVNSSAGTDAKKGIFRTYFYAAQFSATNTGPITNNLTNCKVLTSFYGGGNLGGVIGDVTSTLTDTEVMGSAFGAGYSASVPEVTIYNKNKTAPTLNVYTGIITPTPDPDPNSTSTTYTWTNKTSLGGQTLSTSNPAVLNVDGVNYFYTEESLENLGTVTGKVTLTINGNTVADENGKVMSVAHSVYGGGEESGVDGNTEVNVTGGTIGTTGQGGAEYGNVYGGGKGKDDDVNAGLVKGNTNVNISGTTETTKIIHNVYGGGAFGSVGTFTYDGTTGLPNGLTENTGTTNVTITGGTIGSNGKENGMVFGSSRGSEGDPDEDDNVDKIAWVGNTNVIIGTAHAESNATPAIKGSVYGGGENGHNFHDASVTIHSGTIGIPEGGNITDDGGTPDDPSDDITYSGARYPNRGNVYGSGCGTDTHTKADSKAYFDFNAGIVRGNTTVLIDGGHVVHNVYGGGSMGCVGTYTFDANGKPISCAAGTGTCTVTVSGGQVGVAGAKMAGYGKGGPDDFGHVFGAGRGMMHDPDQYPNVETCAYFNKAILNISGTAFLTGSAYGGSESGHVLGDTEVTISGGQIGCGKDATAPFASEVWADDYVPTSAVSMDCASWPFQAPFASYDPYANATGDLDKYGNGESTEGGRLEASDGHTYYGNVFGGGSGSIPYFDTTTRVSKYLSSAGTVEGNTTVTISGGHILTNVYGGCEATNVLGSATITMTGGTVGVPRTVAQITAHPLTGYIFGAGKGDQRIFFNKETNVDRTFVNIEGGKVYGSIFGGGEDGHVLQNTTVNIGKTGEEGPTIGTWGTSYVDGNVFGGGRGFSGEALTAGNIGGSIELNIKSGKVLGSVYGGGRLASVGYGLYLVDEEIEEGGETIKPYGILRPDDQYDGSYPNPSTQDASDYFDKGRGYITINITGGTIGNDNEYIYNPTTAQKAAIPYTTFDYHNRLQYTKGGNVFTGGMGRLYMLDNTTLLPLWTKLGKCKQTTLNMTGGIVKSNIYGGGEIGAVAQNATVNINGGTVGTKIVDSEDPTNYYYFGSVFGGGKGSIDNITYPGGTAEADKIPISHAGMTGGNVEVKLNETVAANDEATGAIVHQIFGCNDMNGTPKGSVTVHVYATQNEEKANIATKLEKNTESFDVMAVYGGGNLAAYEPTDLLTGKTHVIIDGCGLTSVRQVYGGGNAASTPATSVTINGTYEIEEVFGGGNGFDALPNGDPNPGANVGYKDYHLVENNPEYATKEVRVDGSAFAPYRYGTGKAAVNIFGGTIHRVFGGSNTKGNVRHSVITTLDENSGCEFCVDEAYGGGKSAPMDAEVKMMMACIPGLKAAYGGAEEADVQGDVTLNITNGNFDRVFGGNNISGTIGGTITVNIEETGCHLITIGQLYGGGNQAAYTGPLKPGSTTERQGPTLNVRSFSSIGEVYGGGYGKTATVTGDTYVNINVCEGKDFGASQMTEVARANTYTGERTLSFTEYRRTDNGGFALDGSSNRIIDTREVNLFIPPFTSGIGAINTIYGGGNAAKVVGNTHVNIGTATGNPVVFETPTSADETSRTHTVKGANIKGNVYGGGNAAEVTGKTFVQIGKKVE